MNELHSHSLYDHICALRLTASVLYDKGRAAGKSHEEMMTDIEPLMHELHRVIHYHVVHHLPSTVMAIKQLESETAKHERDAQFLLKKAEDTRQHLLAIKDALKKDLKKKNSTERAQGDFSVTLVGEEITLR